MGTRHIIRVFDTDGTMKVSQYGQWDGYITGQGIDILRFLYGTGNIGALQAHLDKCKELTKEQADKMNKALYSQAMLGFSESDLGILFNQSLYSRDLGSKILYRIAYAPSGDIPLLMENVTADTWCEYEYDIDFKTRRFSILLLGGKHHGKKIASWSFDSLPTENDLERLESCLSKIYSDNADERNEAMEKMEEFQS